MLSGNLRCLTLVDFVNERGQKKPDQTVYTFISSPGEETSTTYHELEQRARAVGAILQAAAAPGDRVLLLFPPGLDYIVAFLGCLYAGMIAVPVYPPRLNNRPMPRFQAIVEDAQATVALTDSNILDKLQKRLEHAPYLSSLRWIATDKISLQDSITWKMPTIDGDTVAFVQYTSGSTASPKGVILTHDNLLTNLKLIHESFAITDESHGVIWLPPYHDMGLIGGILQPLYGGVAATLMSPVAFLQRPLTWLETISNQPGKVVSGGPNFAYDLCVDKIDAAAIPSLDLSRWQVAFNGAEPIRATTMERFAAAFAPSGFQYKAFYPCYGLAEATLIVAGGRAEEPAKLHTVDPVALRQNKIIPTGGAGQPLVSSGRTLSGQEILIVDPEKLIPAPPQTIGEIWVKGASVAQGYWQQPEKTKATFGAYLTDSGVGPYLRTGDLGYLYEGELYVTGRIKDLIIIRGRNYYPQDIELTVEQSHEALQPSCGAAITVTINDTEQLVILQELKRHYVRSEGKESIINAIREAVFQEFELPTYAVLLLKPGTIPKTSSGKIQRHLCQTRFLENHFDEVASSILSKTPHDAKPVPAPETRFIRKALQTTPDKAVRRSLLILYLQEQAKRLLALSSAEISPEQPLSQLGIDSLTAVEFTHLLETEFSISLPLTLFLEGITLGELATHILQAETSLNGSAPSAAARTPSFPTGITPASHGQQALWFLQQLNPESAAYNIANAVRIIAPLDKTILQRALQQLIERHASLRTTFARVDERLVQRIASTSRLDFSAIEARYWSQEHLDEQLAQEAHRPFDLQQDVLLRIRLYQLADDTHVLLLVLHHIITDFWSLAVLVRELAEIYGAESSGQTAVLPLLHWQYADYVQHEILLLEGQHGQERWRYWQKQLHGHLPVLDLPTDFRRPPLQTFHGAMRAGQWGHELVAQLHQFSRQQGVTLYMTLVAAFQVLLHRYTRQTDILIGSPSANRSHSDLAGIVGYFVNPLVLRANLEGDPTFETFLQQVRGTVLDGFAHQDYPFALLAERLQPQRDPSRSPVFQAMFMFQNAPYRGRALDLTPFALSEPGNQIAIGNLLIEPAPIPTQTAQFDLTLMVAETPQGLRAAIQYNSDLFRPETMERMLNHYAVLLSDIVTNAQQPISRLTLLAKHDHQRTLRTWNQSAVHLPEIQCLQQQFEAQVTRTPAAEAIIFEDQILSYAELNERANQLAHHLRALGVGPDVLVGVCMRRSPEMMVALLGVLKAGGAYVPLDPTYPAERIGFILQDAEAPILLSQHVLQERLTGYRGRILCLDSDWPTISQEPASNPVLQTTPQNLAYVIYTSGSTGRPKGVMVQHDSVHNFFVAMDEKIVCAPNDTLLAVTSISFDISVLELFWTLVRGVRVVLLAEEAISDTVAPVISASTRAIEFSLFYFAADESQADQDKYELLLEGAKFADQHNFHAVWTPERHFHAFGGLYPNPSVIGAALATITKKVRIRAGSVVLPLHHPVRIAEEWSVVDNLSRGRVDIAFASGWHANDFIFFPQNYEKRREIMAEGITTIRGLWRGESITVTGGAGNTLNVSILPRPVQPELPIWITAAGNPETFIEAGKIGANILTHLLGQSFEELAEKIKLYRQARATHGYPAHTGHVSLMLHTFVSDDAAAIRDIVRIPFINYLRTSVGLIAGLVRSLNLPFDIDNMSESDMATLLNFAFDRYFDTSALFGTPESALAIIEQIKAIDVDEVACLIDFGIAPDTVLNNLPHLARLRENANHTQQTARYSLVAQAQRYRPTLMQCTPSLMSLILLNPATTTALQSLRVLMLGGEALPATLAQQVKNQLPAQLVNMYGPTETTIWSATHKIETIENPIPIGGPIANTQIYVLDRHMQPVPAGVSGELYLGGQGVTRGYQRRAGLTAERFVPDPFSKQPGQRLYRTGDLARHRPDGTVEFLGRLDFQVKVRGFRVEPGEIERVLTGSDQVREAVVVAREDTPGDVRLVAYVVPQSNLNGSDGTQEWRTFLKSHLPDYMIPSIFMKLDRLPLTPNGKINRRALPAPLGKRDNSGFVAPRSQIEQKIAAIWQHALKVDKVGVDDNFFDLGGHSLLMAHVHSQICQTFDRQIPLVKMLEHPTVSTMAKFLAEEQNEQAIVVQGQERAQKQRAARRQMRRVGS